jgi:predicted MPP superfamily phosphohydrolase
MKSIIKKYPKLSAIAAVMVTAVALHGQPLPKLSADKDAFNFFIVSDVGRNGYYKQKTVANTLGELAEQTGPKFIIASGDTFHYNGVRSTSDPLWMSNFENIYTHPELLIDWYVVLGNHEYRGNTQAVLDYAKISRRWNIPSRYYTMKQKIDDSTSLRIVFIDTAPFVTDYRKQPDKYPDIQQQDAGRQLAWIDSVLSVSTEKWKIVVGHHPVYSVDGKHGSTDELIEQLDPVLRKYKVDFYFSGHIHNAQHIQKDGMDYIVTPSGSLGRPASKGPDTKFADPSEGFTFCSASGNRFTVVFVNSKGEELYRYNKEK